MRRPERWHGRALALALSLAWASTACDWPPGAATPGDEIIYPLYLLSGVSPVRIDVTASAALLTELGAAAEPTACATAVVVAGDVEERRWAAETPVCDTVTPGPIYGVRLAIEDGTAVTAAGDVPAWPEDAAGAPVTTVDLSAPFSVRRGRVTTVSVRLRVEGARCLDTAGAEVPLADDACAEVRYRLGAGRRGLKRTAWEDFYAVPQQVFGGVAPGTTVDRVHEIALENGLRVVSVGPYDDFLLWHPRLRSSWDASEAVAAEADVVFALPNFFVYAR